MILNKKMQSILRKPIPTALKERWEGGQMLNN